MLCDRWLVELKGGDGRGQGQAEQRWVSVIIRSVIRDGSECVVVVRFGLAARNERGKRSETCKQTSLVQRMVKFGCPV
jgi:hypothetical protein